MSLEKTIDSLEQLQATIGSEAARGTLLLVDLIGSTHYKTRNHELTWLARLRAFYQAVDAAIAPFLVTKYLGDGILVFIPDTEKPVAECYELARNVVASLRETKKAYAGDHAIEARIIVGYGDVYRFGGIDPQGTEVDKVFRMEKLVPSGCIGMTREFVHAAQVPDACPVGSYRLKGLPEDSHQLFLASDCVEPATLNELEIRAALTEIWDLGRLGEGKIFVVCGHIPPEDVSGEHYLQMGDKDAIVKAVLNVARVGRIGDLQEVVCDQLSEDMARENVVCIGGPYYNSWTRRFMREIEVPLIFDFSDATGERTPIHNCMDGKDLDSEFSGKSLCRDWGFFARFRNPLNPDRHVILACGIESPAVSGVVRAFSDKQNSNFIHLWRAVRDTACANQSDTIVTPDFFCLMPFEVESGIAVMPAKEDQTRTILTDWKSTHDKRRQERPPTE